MEVRIIPHQTMDDWRAVHDPERRTITYQQRRGGEWVTDYTSHDWDRQQWFYTGRWGRSEA